MVYWCVRVISNYDVYAMDIIFKWKRLVYCIAYIVNYFFVVVELFYQYYLNQGFEFHIFRCVSVNILRVDLGSIFQADLLNKRDDTQTFFNPKWAQAHTNFYYESLALAVQLSNIV